MITTAIFPGRYVQGAGSLQLLGGFAHEFGSGAVALCDRHVYEQYKDELWASFDEDMDFSIERFSGECCDDEIERVADLAKAIGASVIIGIGGGKALDTAKAAAFSADTNCIIVPTIASTDAPCSALSVVYHPDGRFKRYQLLPRNPDIVLVDSTLCARAPTRFLVSGMGDALATWYEAEDCRIKRGANMIGRSGTMSAYALARLCNDTLLEYGDLARLSCEQDVVTSALEHVIEANTLLSGVGFESGGLAAAHAIHNGLTVLPQTHSYYHGEKVAIGLQAMMFLTDRSSDTIDEVFDFCETIGLPTTLMQIGLDHTDRAHLYEASIAACAPGETIHNEPFEVTPDRVSASLLVADAEGRRRRARSASARPRP